MEIFCLSFFFTRLRRIFFSLLPNFMNVLFALLFQPVYFFNFTHHLWNPHQTCRTINFWLNRHGDQLRSLIVINTLTNKMAPTLRKYSLYPFSRVFTSLFLFLSTIDSKSHDSLDALIGFVCVWIHNIRFGGCCIHVEEILKINFMVGVEGVEWMYVNWGFLWLNCTPGRFNLAYDIVFCLF